jgi:hypothetical protein
MKSQNPGHTGKNIAPSMPVIVKEKVLLLSTSANTHFHQECAFITKKLHNFVTIINIKGNASRCPR